jgi:PAS domain S-box-containing protein
LSAMVRKMGFTEVFNNKRDGRQWPEPAGEGISEPFETTWLGRELLPLQFTLRALFVIALPTLACLVVYNLLQGRLPEAILVFSMGGVLLIAFFVMRKSTSRPLAAEKLYRIYRNEIRCFLLIFLAYLCFSAGWKNEIDRVQWSYIFPIVAFLCLARREGLLWSVLFLAGMAFVLLSRPGAAFSADPLLGFKVRYLLSFLIMCAVGFTGKYGIETIYARLALQQKKLAQSEENYREAYDALFRETQERQHAQQALAESEEKYRLIFENSADVIYCIDRELKVIDVSPSVEKVLGYSPLELVGRPVQELDLLAPEDLEHAFSDIVHVLGGTPIPRDYYTFIAKDGTRRYAEVSGAPLMRDGVVVGVISVGRDVTLQKKAEEDLRRSHEELEKRVRERTAELGNTVQALEAANLAKSEFLANMSHELRTPLNAIIGFTELLIDKRLGDLTAGQMEYLNDVLQSSSHLLSMINDILDLSKVEAGKMELESSDVDLKKLLENSLMMIKEKALKHGITLERDLNGIPEIIRADERKVKQVLYNLLSNAAKFTPDGGEIVLGARLANEKETCKGSGESLEIWVKDNGIGLKREDLDRIFDPFEQVENSMSRRFQGTGLGLALTRTFVTLHGGRIWAESEGIGKGSTFRFVIPLSQKE